MSEKRAQKETRIEKAITFKAREKTRIPRTFRGGPAGKTERRCFVSEMAEHIFARSIEVRHEEAVQAQQADSRKKGNH